MPCLAEHCVMGISAVDVALNGFAGYIVSRLLRRSEGMNLSAPACTPEFRNDATYLPAVQRLVLLGIPGGYFARRLQAL